MRRRRGAVGPWVKVPTKVKFVGNSLGLDPVLLTAGNVTGIFARLSAPLGKRCRVMFAEVVFVEEPLK